MTHYEGILVSWNDHVNSAAMGADIEGDRMLLNVYVPSNTYLNLKEEGRFTGKPVGSPDTYRAEPSKFTYSLTNSRELFYKSTLTGHHDDVCELGCSDLAKKDDFYYPTSASVTYFCKVESEKKVKKKDGFGETDIFRFEARILEKEGDGVYIDRDDPVVDALVYASRYHLGDEEQRAKIRKKVQDILKGVEGDVADKVRDYVKEEEL
ncbi:MAG: DUF447 domain-containing protein [Thermoplasmatota archaeon]